MDFSILLLVAAFIVTKNYVNAKPLDTRISASQTSISTTEKWLGKNITNVRSSQNVKSTTTPRLKVNVKSDSIIFPTQIDRKTVTTTLKTARFDDNETPSQINIRNMINVPKRCSKGKILNNNKICVDEWDENE